MYTHVYIYIYIYIISICLCIDLSMIGMIYGGFYFVCDLQRPVGLGRLHALPDQAVQNLLRSLLGGLNIIFSSRSHLNIGATKKGG